ncbi:hypothetical protein NliqN6_2128 [Naganishia liquefaciens]|uniref:SCP domain-containing protein n=1 Tax=Naganishia liquefaciens TaxID=104408 RepID=A0A8H3TQT7_9TREE|nr:hypothetical protein NliqN6_2128 [Naganishia liquefaciens]
MQLTFLFALLPLLGGVAQASNPDRGLDIRVVEGRSTRGSDDGLTRRAGETVVNSYVQCEQVCRAYFGPSGTPLTAAAAPTLVQFARSSATARPSSTSSKATATSTASALPVINNNAATLTADEQRMLNEHNTFRAKYGANPLTWNATLATFAKNYASQCKFAHSGGPYGENLASSYGYSDPIGTGLTGWEKEAAQYDYNNPTFSPTTGHFTQMVWKSTTQLGCALITCPAKTLYQASSSSSYLICEYYKPGNYLGQFATQVGRPV